jgi:hypothetical protein
VPGPMRRRLPVGYMVMLVNVPNPARRRQNHPFLQPPRFTTAQSRRRWILPRRRPPSPILPLNMPIRPLMNRKTRLFRRRVPRRPVKSYRKLLNRMPKRQPIR